MFYVITMVNTKKISRTYTKRKENLIGTNKSKKIARDEGGKIRLHTVQKMTEWQH